MKTSAVGDSQRWIGCPSDGPVALHLPTHPELEDNKRKEKEREKGKDNNKDLGSSLSAYPLPLPLDCNKERKKKRVHAPWTLLPCQSS